MTDLDLDAIKARADAATEGPWRSGGEQVSAEGPERWSYPLKTMIRDIIDIGGGNWGGEGGGYSMARADAEFIAHARTDVPALVAEVERLQAIVTEQRRIVFDPVSDYYGEIRAKFEALDDTRTAASSPSDSSSTGGEL